MVGSSDHMECDICLAGVLNKVKPNGNCLLRLLTAMQLSGGDIEDNYVDALTAAPEAEYFQMSADVPDENLPSTELIERSRPSTTATNCGSLLMLA